MAKNRIPKKLAGITTPKALRKNLILKNLIGSAAGRQLLGEALVAAAGAAAAVLAATKTETGAKAGEAVAHAGEEGGEVIKHALKSAADAVAGTLSSAAQNALGVDKPRDERRSRAH